VIYKALAQEYEERTFTARTPVVVDVALEPDPVTASLAGKTKVMPTDLMEQAAIECADSLSQTAQE